MASAANATFARREAVRRGGSIRLSSVSSRPVSAAAAPSASSGTPASSGPGAAGRLIEGGALRAAGSGALHFALVLASDAGQDVIHRREAHDLAPRDAPRLLDDPREGAILTVGLCLDLVEHVLGEIQGLLSLVGAGHQLSMSVCGGFVACTRPPVSRSSCRFTS